jgi:2-methylisocitrate lyase-like PEP mutase family enzyme
MPGHIQVLREMLARDRGVILPGAPNALSARVIGDLGFKAIYLTGAGLTNMDLLAKLPITFWRFVALSICH